MLVLDAYHIRISVTSSPSVRHDSCDNEVYPAVTYVSSIF